VTEHLLSKHEALSSNPSTAKKKKNAFMILVGFGGESQSDVFNPYLLSDVLTATTGRICPVTLCGHEGYFNSREGLIY
jgi:hypothetical protein